MKYGPQVGITVSIDGYFHPVAVDWSISLTGADDTTAQIAVHKAETAGLDFVKAKMQPQISAVEDAVYAAVKERFNLP